MLSFIQSCFSMELGTSLVQSSEEKTPFSFGFLSSKYPHLMPLAEQEFQSNDAEEKSYLESNLTREEPFLSAVMSTMNTSVFDPRALLTDLGGIERYESCCREYLTALKPFLSQLSDVGFFYTVKNRKENPKNIFEDIVLASEYIYEIVKSQGQEGSNLVLSLGRTPSPVHIIYQTVLELTKCQDQKAVHLNFSGDPDMDVIRSAPFYARNQDLVRARNMVTQDKLAHYFEYMDTLNILEHKKIYIVDMLGTGGGLNSFLKILQNYFFYKQTALPVIEFLWLTFDVDMKYFKHKAAVKYEGKTLGRGILCFIENCEKNFSAFNIPTSIIPITYLTLRMMLDNTLFQDLGSFGIEYPAQKWTSRYDEERKRGGKYSDKFTSFIKKNSINIINFHMKKQPKETAQHL